MPVLKIPGVPPLLFPPLPYPAGALPPFPQLPSAGQVLTSDAGGLPVAPNQKSKWGIYTAGSTVVLAIAPDSIVSLEYKRDWRIPNYPQENGAFESYNKVKMPFDARLHMTKGGSLADRQAFLIDLESAAASLDLYDIVTPEETYLNANISHINYMRRADHGLGLIEVEIWLTEIRVTSNPSFSNTIDPSSQSKVNDGTVQAQPLTTAASNASTTIVNPNTATVTSLQDTSSTVDPAVAAPIISSQTPAQQVAAPVFDSIPRDIQGAAVSILQGQVNAYYNKVTGDIRKTLTIPGVSFSTSLLPFPNRIL